MAVQGAAPTELGTERISTLLRKYAVPGIIAMIASSLYNMVDSIFIGHIPNVGAYAISGLAVTFPLMNLSTALGTLVGVGGQTMVSVLLGQKNYDGAQKVLSNVLSLNTIIGVVFTTLCLIFLDPILYFFGASENTLPFAREYMVIILLGNVITHLYFGLNGVIRASGNPKTAMGLTIFTVTANAILDPVFIYVFDLGHLPGPCSRLHYHLLPRQEEFPPFRKAHIPAGPPHRKSLAFDWPWSLPDALRLLLCLDIHQPAAPQIRRRPFYRRLRNLEPHYLHVPDD